MSWQDVLKEKSRSSGVTIDNSVGFELRRWINSIKDGTSRGYPSKEEIAENRAKFDTFAKNMENLYSELEKLMKKPFSQEDMDKIRSDMREKRRIAQAAGEIQAEIDRGIRLAPMHEKQIATEKRKRRRAKELGVEREPKLTHLLPADEE